MGISRAWPSRVLLTLVLCLTGVRHVLAQAREWSGDFSDAANRMARAVKPSGIRAGAVRVGVVPITTTDTALATLAEAATRQLIQALDRAPRQNSRAVEILDGAWPTISEADHHLWARPPVDLPEALRAAQRANASYVVLGSLVESSAQFPMRVELQLVDVAEGRVVENTSAPVVLAAAPDAPRARSFWTSKPLGIIAGVGLSAMAATFAWRANQDVEARKTALEAVPAGEPDVWNRLHDEASGAAKGRDFWWSVSIGVAAVTTSYVVLTSSPDVAPTRPPALPAPRAGRRGWSVQIDPAGPRIWLAHFF